MDSNGEKPVSSKFELLNLAGSKQNFVLFLFFLFQNLPEKKKRIPKSPGKVVKIRPIRQSAKIPSSKRLNGVLRRFLANIRRWQSGRLESEDEEEQHIRIEEVVDKESDEPKEPKTLEDNIQIEEFVEEEPDEPEEPKAMEEHIRIEEIEDLESGEPHTMEEHIRIEEVEDIESDEPQEPNTMEQHIQIEEFVEESDEPEEPKIIEEHIRIEEVEDIESDEPQEPKTTSDEFITDCGDNHDLPMEGVHNVDVDEGSIE